MRTLVLATTLLALGCSGTTTEAPATAEAPAAPAPAAETPAASESLPDRDPALAKRLVEEATDLGYGERLIRTRLTVLKARAFAETQRGELLWVYYDRQRRRWFLQGVVD